MDIKDTISDIVKKITGNKDLIAKFKKDPKGVVKSLSSVDLPGDAVDKIVDAVKAKIGADKVGGALGKIGGLFGKK